MMVRSLSVSVVLLFSAVAHGSKDGETQELVQLVKRATDNHDGGQLFKRAEATKLARRIHWPDNQPHPERLRPGPRPYNRQPNGGNSPLIQDYPPVQGYTPGGTNMPFTQGLPPNPGYPNGPGSPDGFQGPQGYPDNVQGGAYGDGIVQGVDVTGASGGTYDSGASGSGFASGMDASGGYGSGAGMDGVMGGYSNLLGQVQSCQSAFAAGGISAQIAMQQVEQLAMQFQAVISQFLACTTCLASSGISAFGGVFSSLFTSFNALVSSYRQFFPNTYTSMFSGPFSGLNTILAQFLAVCQNSGLPVTSFFPPPLGQFFGQLGFSQVSSQLQQIGYSL